MSSTLVAGRVSQGAFDDAVRENMEEFDMEREEAVVDAVKQFESQGVDLRNINTTGEVNPALSALIALQEHMEEHKDDAVVEPAPLIAPLRTLLSQLKDADAHLRQLVSTNMGLPTLFRSIAFADRLTKPPATWGAPKTAERLAQQFARHLVVEEGETPANECIAMVITLALRSITLLIQNNMQNRDSVNQPGVSTMIVVLSNHSDDAVLLTAIFGTLRAALLRCETNKLCFKNAGGNELAMHVLKTHRRNRDCFLAGLELLCAATTQDDLRDQASVVGESAEQWVQLGVFGLILNGLRKASQFKAPAAAAGGADAGAAAADAATEAAAAGAAAPPAAPPAAADAVTADFFTADVIASSCRALHCILLKPESIELFMAAGGLDVVLKTLEENAAEARIVRHCVEVLKMLSGDDELKKLVLKQLPFLVALGNRHATTPALVQEIIGTFAIVALRAPDVQGQMVELGCHSIILRTMELELKKGTDRETKIEAARSITLLCKCSLALRNLVSRNEDARRMVLDDGGEATLRSVYAFDACKDDAYAALRDLGVDLDSLGRKYYAHGTEKQTYKKEANFRQVSNVSENMAAAYQERARETGCA
jgi:hypothetical protein